jgi:hypothetical protein
MINQADSWAIKSAGYGHKIESAEGVFLGWYEKESDALAMVQRHKTRFAKENLRATNTNKES